MLSSTRKISNDKRAIVVKFDGIDGCGKTSLRDAVAQYYSDRCRVLVTSEFGSDLDTPAHNIHPDKSVSQILRMLALGKEYDIDDVERQILLALMSRRNNRIVLSRNLYSKNLILVDRSNLSNLAYGLVLDLGFKSLYDIAVTAVDRYDIIFWIDTPIEVCASRLSGHNLDAVEMKGESYQSLVREQFEHLCSTNQNVLRLDGNLQLLKLVTDVAEKIDTQMNYDS